jgi:Zn-dependent M28 family amino/carboxypeptidase
MHFSKVYLSRQITVSLLLLVLVSCASSKATPTVAPEADRSRYVKDVEFIAQGPRTTTDPQHQAVQDLCAERLTELGYDVERYDFEDGVSVIGTLPGSTRPDEIVIVSAHYDTISGGNGADDNASGVAGVLETARLLADETHARTLVVACWDQEEPAMYGSYRYAIRESEKKTDIKVAYVLDEIGFSDDKPNSQRVPSGFDIAYPGEAAKIRANQYRANFVLLIADQQASQWASLIADSAGKVGLQAALLKVDINGTIDPNLRNSDHASFWKRGYPAIQITDTAKYRNPFQHTKLDTFETLDYDFAIRVVSAVVSSVRSALDASD